MLAAIGLMVVMAVRRGAKVLDRAGRPRGGMMANHQFISDTGTVPGKMNRQVGLDEKPEDTKPTRDVACS